MGALARAATVEELPRGALVGGRYRVEVTLGKGAGGVVYRAFDEKTTTLVCLKMLRAGKDEAGDLDRRFEREWQLARRLEHPSICRPLDHGRQHGVPWLVLELIQGRTLSEWLEAGPLPSDLARAVAVQVAAALGAAHDAGVVHRDVKPGNIMIEPSGRVVLLDFGIALGQGQERLTKPGFLLGSAHYVAPEVWQGRDITPKSDVWSYGVVLYACLTGRRPFTAPAPAKLVQQILSASPPRPRLFNKEVAPDLERVASACLQVDAERRPTSGRELLALVEGRRVTRRLREVSRTLIAPREVTMLPAPISFPGAPPHDDLARGKTQLVFRSKHQRAASPSHHTKTLLLLAPRLRAIAPALPVLPMLSAVAALLVAAFVVVHGGPSPSIADVMVQAAPVGGPAPLPPAPPRPSATPPPVTSTVLENTSHVDVLAPVERERPSPQRSKRARRVRRARERSTPAPAAIVVDQPLVEQKLMRFNRAYDRLSSDEERAAFVEHALVIKRAMDVGDLDAAYQALSRALTALPRESP